LLPTPPGSETSSYDSQFLLQKPSDAFTSLVSAYGTYSTSVDYHNAMTPPSSVSPRENATNNNNNNSSGKPSLNLQTSSSLFEYAQDARSQYGPESAASMHQLPLKPQPYSAAVMHHHNSLEAYSLDQAQFFPHHSGFHLYKNSPSASWGV
jgi:neuronal PAS domain-containing protein 1/3